MTTAQTTVYALPDGSKTPHGDLPGGSGVGGSGLPWWLVTAEGDCPCGKPDCPEPKESDEIVVACL